MKRPITSLKDLRTGARYIRLLKNCYGEIFFAVYTVVSKPKVVKIKYKDKFFPDVKVVKIDIRYYSEYSNTSWVDDWYLDDFYTRRTTNGIINKLYPFSNKLLNKFKTASIEQLKQIIEF